jgi:GH25 family lysozyme M1 (1,4-beta-N-acetylmuramidase)
MPTIANMPRGIDVSKHQARVDWARVAAAGFKFGFARAIDDRTGTTADPQLRNNLAGMRANGIFRGAYHFFRPNRNVAAAANLFVSLLGRLEPGDLNPVLDIEIDGGLSANRIIEGAAQWIDTVEAALGRQVIIYTFGSFWQTTLGNTPRFRDRPLWIAHFTNAPQPRFPNVWSSFTFWQHSEKGRVPGVTGDCDLDRFNGSMDGLRAFAGLPPANANIPVADITGAGTGAGTTRSMPARTAKAAQKAPKSKSTTAKKAGAKKSAGKKAASKKAVAKGGANKPAARKAASKQASKGGAKKSRK